MKIVCPYCNSSEYECYDRTGEGTFQPIDLCVCENCEKQFKVIYTVSHVEKDD